MGSVGLDAGANPVEHIDRQALRVVSCLEHQRRDGADQHGLGNALRAMPRDVANDFAAAGGVSDVNGVSQIQSFGECGEIVGVGVDVVSVARLAGPTMAAPIMRDRAKAVRREEEQLVVPGVSIERPAVTEDKRLPCAPILVKDSCSILRGNSWHISLR